MGHRFNESPVRLGVEKSGEFLKQFATIWETDHLLIKFF